MTRELAANDATDEESLPFRYLLPENVLNHVFVDCLKNEYSLVSVEETKSAQQQVFIIQVARKAETTTTVDEIWSDCLKNGRNRLVVRIWKGGSNWWNLNRNQDPWILARQEIKGYQLAHQAFQKEKNQTTSNNNISIPRVLHHQLGSDKQSSSSSACCWAVLEYYVGLHSTLFDDDDEENHRIPDSWYMERMIKVRHEFGFDEPHPRWGRVPTEDCLEYATMVLKEVVLPLQKNTKQRTINHDNTNSGSNNDSNHTKPQDFGTMLQKYQKAFQEILSSVSSTHHHHDKNNHNGTTIIITQICDDERIRKALETVKEAVTDILPQHLSHIPPMAPVLVHLDLQPQNLLFYRTTTTTTTQQHQSTTTFTTKQQQQQQQLPTTNADGIHVSSVLDWEDAFLADPRLEILLLCRKVCANRLQANALWSLFEDYYYSVCNRQDDDDDDDSYSPNTTTTPVGPMEPWLQLECIHSIITLLLQIMDLLNGGRNPWETKKDLWGKLQREFHRWNELVS